MGHQLFFNALGFLVCTTLPQIATSVELRAPQGTQQAKFILESGDHLIHDLIKKSGSYLKRTYLVDKSQAPAICNPDDAAGKIHVPTRLELDAAGCEEIVGQMLATRGWYAVPLDRDRGVWDWVWIQGARNRDVKKRVTFMDADEVLRRPKVVEYVSTIVSLENINAQLATANLRTFFNDPRGLSSLIPAGGNSQRLVVLAGFRPDVAETIRLLRKLDAAATKEASFLQARLQKLEQRLQALEQKR